MQTLSTQCGDIQIHPIERETFANIRQLLPFGAVGLQQKDSTAIEYGIVMQCDDEEVFGIKLQPVDVDKEQANYLLQANTILIAHALPIYLQHGFSGIMMPLPYYREKGERFESGIAMFIFPEPTGKESTLDIPHASGFDNRFGKGCTVMLTAFINALKQSAQETGINLYTVIGMDPRPRLQLGSLLFGYLAAGSSLIVIKRAISDEDISWSILREAGITEVQHMPACTFGITKDDLRVSKPV